MQQEQNYAIAGSYANAYGKRLAQQEPSYEDPTNSVGNLITEEEAVHPE